MTHADYLNGSYLLTFRQVAKEPFSLPLFESPQITLWGTDLGFVATTRVKAARYRNCKLSFPYMPSKAGRPNHDTPVKTYFCAFEAITEKKEYATLKYQIFLSGEQTSKPVANACRTIAKSILRGRALVDSADKYGFWMPYHASIHKIVNGAGCMDGLLYVLRKDGKKYKYVSLCSETDFKQLYTIASSFSSYSYFCDICKDL